MECLLIHKKHVLGGKIMTDILTTYVSKGGTGKTTITVNFAAMAASKGKKGKEFDYESGCSYETFSNKEGWQNTL
jgi:hypothetical protein